MKVLIVGATGFVASALIDNVKLKKGISIVAGVRDPRRSKLGAGIEVRRTDALEPETIVDAMSDVTHVVNCVMGEPDVMRRATEAILAGAERRSVRVIQLSSVAVYGDRVGVVSEDAPLDPKDSYALAKVDCDVAVIDACRRGVSAVIMRPGLIYGSKSLQWSIRIARLLKQSRLGDMGPLGDGFCNIVHVDDVAGAIAASAFDFPSASGIFNLAEPNPPTWNEYLMCFARALGATPVRRIPAWQLKLERLAAPGLRICEILLGKVGARDLVPPPVTPSMRRQFSLQAIYDSGRADFLFDGQRIPWGAGVAMVGERLASARS